MARYPTTSKYKAFISYRHDRTKPFAARLELALKQYAKPLFAPPFKIFRDENHLVPDNDLPSLIYNALHLSEYFILLASPASACSPWVRDEIEHWCGHLQRTDRLIIVLLDGDIAVSPDEKNIDWENTDALPEILKTYLSKVPLYIDFRWAKTEEALDLAHADFRRAVNAISARIRDVDPNELLGIEVREHKRNIRRRRGAVFALTLLTIAATIAALYAWNRNQLANDRLHSALSTAKNIDVLIHDDLERVAGADTIRYKLLEDTAALLHSLGAETSPATKETEAIHLIQQGLIANSHEGSAAAKPLFEEAVKLLRVLIEEGNGSPDTESHVNVAMTHLGDAESDLGAHAAAKAIFEQVLVSRTKRLQHQSSKSALQKVAISHDRIAQVSAKLGDSTEAVAHQHRAIDFVQQALTMDSADPESMKLMAALLLHLGDIERETGVSPDYMRRYERSGHLLQSLLKQSPFDATIKEDLAVLHERIGTMESLETSLRLRETLSEAEPANIDWRIDRAIAHARLADHLLGKSERTRAKDHLAACSDALSIAKRQDDIAPRQKRLVAETLDRIADLTLQSGGQPDALLNESLSIKKLLLKQHPQDTVVRQGLVATMTKLSDTRASIGDDAAAKRWLDEAYRHLLILRERSPDRLDFARDMASVHDRLADYEQSVAHREESLKLRQRIAQKQQNNNEAQFELSRSEQELAAIIVRTDPHRAASLYNQAESRLDALLNTESPNTSTIEAMAVLQLRQGDIVPPDNAADALERYHRAYDLFGRNTDSGNPAALNRAAIAAQRLAKSYQAVGDKNHARRFYEEAAAICRNALSRNRAAPDLWERLGEISLAQSDLFEESSAGKRKLSPLQTFVSESAWQMTEERPRLSWLDTRVDVLAALGNHQIALNAYGDAAASVQEILNIRQRVVSGVVHPLPSEERVTLEREAIFRGLDMISKLQRKSGNQNAALTALERRAALAHGQASAPSTNTSWKKRALQATVEFFNLTQKLKREDKAPSAAQQVLDSVSRFENDPLLKDDPMLDDVKPALSQLRELVH